MYFFCSKGDIAYLDWWMNPELVKSVKYPEPLLISRDRNHLLFQRQSDRVLTNVRISPKCRSAIKLASKETMKIFTSNR